MYFYYNPECKVDIKPQTYDYYLTTEHLREKKGINLEARIRELDKTQVVLHKVTKLQHGDCNGSNMICAKRGTKLIDFPNFGLWSSSLDFASYSIIVGVGNNQIFNSPNFPDLLNFYLAHELTAEKGNYNTFRDQSLSNDECNSGISSLISESDYANFILSVWDDALRKNVQLAGTFARYKEQPNSKMFGIDSSSLIGSDPEVIYNLFSIISRQGCPFERCSNQQEAREYFYQFGRFFVDLGICSEQYDLTKLLNDIKSSALKNGVFDLHWPRFKQ